MKNSAQLFVAFAFSLLSFLANAEIIKIPVDPSVTAASGTAGYDPTVMNSSSSGPGLYVQSSDAAAASSGGNFTAQGTVGTLSTSIGQLLRWPALPKYTYFQPMSNNEAYYRDAFTAITYTATASHDGQTWDVKATIVPTTGATTTFDWPTMTYYQQVSGYPYCFYMPGWAYYICGSTSIFITAYTNSQCQPYGNWTFAVSEDGGPVGQLSFTMLGEVPPEDLVAWNQAGSAASEIYDSICYYKDANGKKISRACTATDQPLPIPYTIKEKGCALTSTAMVLNYHSAGGGEYDALTSLNTYLVSNGGYNQSGNIAWTPLQGSSSYTNQAAWFGPFGGADDAALKKNICKFGPQVMAVKPYVYEGKIYAGHFVMVVGRYPDDTTWKIHDPSGGSIRRLAGPPYNDIYLGTRNFRGRQVTYVDALNGLIFRLYSPAELVITAPDGKKTGFDPVSGSSYNAIPRSSYQNEGLTDDETDQIDEHGQSVFMAMGAAEGEYTVAVTGTATGAYALEMSQLNTSGDPLPGTIIRDVPITAGETHMYAVDYAVNSTTTPELGGGYDGGGQKPSDVNRFLRYSNPSQARTTLPAGTTAFRLAINYGETTLPATFSAILNGVDITPSFAPIPGGKQTVEIPLVSGSNTLVLSINGATASSRVATDTDRLVFLVQ